MEHIQTADRREQISDTNTRLLHNQIKYENNSIDDRRRVWADNGILVPNNCKSVDEVDSSAYMISLKDAIQNNDYDRAALAYTMLMNMPVTENGDIYNYDNDGDGRLEPTHVNGYYKNDGTYVREHYRALPRK